jgi:hypothetical protein
MNSEIDVVHDILDLPKVLVDIVVTYYDEHPLKFIKSIYISDPDLIIIDDMIYNFFDDDGKRFYRNISNNEVMESNIHEYIISFKYNVTIRNATPAIYNNFESRLNYCDLFIDDKPIKSYCRHMLIHEFTLYHHKLYFNYRSNDECAHIYELDLLSYKHKCITPINSYYYGKIWVDDNNIYITRKYKEICIYNMINKTNITIPSYINMIYHIRNMMAYGMHNNMFKIQCLSETMNETECELYNTKYVSDEYLPHAHTFYIKDNICCGIDFRKQVVVYKLRY